MNLKKTCTWGLNNVSGVVRALLMCIMAYLLSLATLVEVEVEMVVEREREEVGIVVMAIIQMCLSR